MECRDFERLLHLYVDETLDASSTSRVESHLEVCDNCLREVEGLRAVTRGVESYPLLEAPEELVDSVMAQIEKMETIPASTLEQEYLFSVSEMLCAGRIDFPKALFLILYGAMKLAVRLYARTLISALRNAKEQVYFSLTRMDLRRLYSQP